MTIDEAIEVLELHNQWRKGADIPMESPVRLGMAIDLVTCELKSIRHKSVSKEKCACVLKERKQYEIDLNECRICTKTFY